MTKIKSEGLDQLYIIFSYCQSQSQSFIIALFRIIVKCMYRVLNSNKMGENDESEPKINGGE